MTKNHTLIGPFRRSAFIEPFENHTIIGPSQNHTLIGTYFAPGQRADFPGFPPLPSRKTTGSWPKTIHLSDPFKTIQLSDPKGSRGKTIHLSDPSFLGPKLSHFEPKMGQFLEQFFSP